jgi:hypothetical protein
VPHLYRFTAHRSESYLASQINPLRVLSRRRLTVAEPVPFKLADTRESRLSLDVRTCGHTCPERARLQLKSPFSPLSFCGPHFWLTPRCRLPLDDIFYERRNLADASMDFCVWVAPSPLGQFLAR